MVYHLDTCMYPWLPRRCSIKYKTSPGAWTDLTGHDGAQLTHHLLLVFEALSDGQFERRDPLVDITGGGVGGAHGGEDGRRVPGLVGVCCSDARGRLGLGLAGVLGVGHRHLPLSPWRRSSWFPPLHCV
uniref:Uncharacterized protein n=1 Tax=Triticum urartu TaxID=4572 RepID=A0A8R7U1G7_TRIUA